MARNVHTIFHTNNTSIIKDTPFDKIRKIIEAKISFNKLLAAQVMRSSDKEFLQMFALLHFKDEIVQKLNFSNAVNSEFIKFSKRGLSEIIMGYLGNYQILGSVFAQERFDSLYLYTHLMKEQTVFALSKIISESIQGWLLLFGVPMNDMTSMAKSILTAVRKKDLSSPLTEDFKAQTELLEMLGPLVNPLCFRYLEDYKVVFSGGTDLKVEIKKVKLERKLEDQKHRFSRMREKLNDPALDSLFKQYVSIQDTFFVPESHNGIQDAYVNKFEVYKEIQEIAKRFDQRCDELTKQKNQIGSEQKKHKKRNKKGSAVQLEDASNPVDKVLKTPETTVPTVMVAVEPPKQVDAMPETPRQVDAMPMESNEPLVVADVDESKVSVEPPAELNVSCDDIQEDYTSYYAKAVKAPKNVARPPKVKQNILELNQDHQDTFLKVFDSQRRSSINLRDLVNLARALGGEISTTGANRCRIELNNIYAHVLMSDAVLNTPPPTSCKKATITMHGGGHRSTRSQNHDRADAPDYLIKQFQSAFERANYTPETLGLVKSYCAASVN